MEFQSEEHCIHALNGDYKNKVQEGQVQQIGLGSVDYTTEVTFNHKPRGFGPQANYADRAAAACWRSSAKFCG
jgi:hypothetical protein